MDAKKPARLALLLALALGLSYVERFIPLELVIPLPGVKLGLANVVTLFALYALDAPSAALILLPRCLMGSFFGGVSSLLFSLLGGALALLAMILAKKSRFLSVFGVSILGAAAHNVGQVAAAAALLGSWYIVGYLPFLLVLAVPCGLLTGALAAGVLRALPSGAHPQDRDPPRP